MMSDIKPTHYKIREVQDFLNVPEDRLEVCLSEFAVFIGTMRDLERTVNSLAELTGEDPQMTEVTFEWIDDGKKERTIKIHPIIKG